MNRNLQIKEGNWTGEMDHILLSYQRQYQKTVVRLRDALKSHGFTTWFDEDDMVGSVLDSMATAVENASVVIMCMSSSYQKSENCKKEIEYAERQNKPIIPIRVEAGIRPNGWLGIASGSKMVIDFSDPEKFTEKFQRLLKELAAKNIPHVQDCYSGTLSTPTRTKRTNCSPHRDLHRRKLQRIR